MKFSQVYTSVPQGISSLKASVELSILPGLPSFEITGYGDTAVREAQSRVRSALKNSGFEFPKGRVVACLSPAWLKKKGSSFDLALAVAILLASGQIKPTSDQEKVYVFGELGLDGKVKALPALYLRLLCAQENGASFALIPKGNCSEAALLNTLPCYAVGDINEAIEAYNGRGNRIARQAITLEPNLQRNFALALDILMKIKGQQNARRALIVAAAGWHHLLMLGSAGCGKSTLTTSMPYLLPLLSSSEVADLRPVYSAVDYYEQSVLLEHRRPLICPHQSSTVRALLGGGSNLSPGLCSLAHHGVLFLDELSEFPAQILDQLRAAVEDRYINLARDNQVARLPADFLLVAAMNPCRCGNAIDRRSSCTCRKADIRKYLNKISGPFWDRFQLIVPLQSLDEDNLRSLFTPALADAETVLASEITSVAKAWQYQKARCEAAGQVFCLNGKQNSTALQQLWGVTAKQGSLLAQLAQSKHLSARVTQRLLGVARTIADLAERELEEEDILEAVSLRFDPLQSAVVQER